MDREKQRLDELDGHGFNKFHVGFLAIIAFLAVTAVVGVGFLVSRNSAPKKFVTYKAIETQLNTDGVPDWLKTDHDREVFRLGQNDVMRRLALLEVNP